jgi:DNA-binding SARP family transcriptional activator
MSESSFRGLLLRHPRRPWGVACTEASIHADIIGPMALNLLHAFSLTIRMEHVALSSGAQRLVAFLALNQQLMSRAYVAGALWPETTDARANANLRSALWRVQRACSGIVITSPQRLGLASEVVVDVQQAMTGAYRILDGTDSCDEVLRADMLSLLSTDLLRDWYEDDWVLDHRERFHHLRLHALEAMCERFAAAGRYGEAVQAGLAAVRAEPLRESAHRALVKVHLSEGNWVEATRQYDSCCSLLRNELGLGPSPAMQALLDRDYVILDVRLSNTVPVQLDRPRRPA